MDEILGIVIMNVTVWRIPEGLVEINIEVSNYCNCVVSVPEFSRRGSQSLLRSEESRITPDSVDPTTFAVTKLARGTGYRLL